MAPDVDRAVPTVTLWVGVATGALAMALAWLWRRFLVVTVAGFSMGPTLRHGDRLLFRRTVATRLRPGAIVLVSGGQVGIPMIRPPGWIIKRVAAVPGDPVPRDRVPALAGTVESTVPPGLLVLLGDNNDASYDSKQVGYFPASCVRGVMLGRLPRPPERNE